MILTFNIKHNRDFSVELNKAKQIARVAIATRSNSSSSVSTIGLKSAISNQILRKYSRLKKCRSINSVQLTIPGQGIIVNQDTRTIRIPCLKLELPYRFRNDFIKINQAEVDKNFVHLSVTIQEPPEKEVQDWIGVDLNTTGHSTVVALPLTGKVLKLGKSENHIRNKYRKIRQKIQQAQKFKNLKKIKRRERNKIRDLNHKISRKVVDTAAANGCGIKMEDLKDIRETTKQRKSFKGALHSWSFADLQQMISYKAKLLGIPVVFIDPRGTSKRCARCGLEGRRNDKKFTCPHCGHVDHADVNAAFNISMVALAENENLQDGNTDIPVGQRLRSKSCVSDPRTSRL